MKCMFVCLFEKEVMCVCVCVCDIERVRDSKENSCLSHCFWFTVSYHSVSTHQCVLYI